MEKNKLQSLAMIYSILDIEYFLDEITYDFLHNQDTKSVNNINDSDGIVDLAVLNRVNDNPIAQTIPIQEQSKNVHILNNMLNKISSTDNMHKLDLSNIKHLDELKEFLLRFDGCELKKTAINTVFGEGSYNSHILIIGEAPGEQEDETGRPFVGRSGMLLNSALEDVGITRQNSFVTNSIFWRPPGNRNPTQRELDICYPFVERIIQLISPKIIILVGSKATQNILKTDLPISQLRNTWHNVSTPCESLIRVVFHPAYLLRNPTQKKFLWYDMLAIKKQCQILNIL